ncbi:MAG: uroporphyrinogen decarboxylase family protein [Candidatus Aminicenantales bacterium]
MSLEKPDRVPVMCQMSIGHMLLQLNVSPHEFWYSEEVFASGLLKLRQQYQFDGILISLHGHSPWWRKEILRISKEENTETVFWKNGERTVFAPDGLPRHIPSKERKRPQIEEIDPEKISEEIDFIPVCEGLEFRLDRENLYSIFEFIKEQADDYSIHGEVTSPFDYFVNLFGLYQAMLSLAQQPSRSKEILQRYTEGVKKIAVGEACHGVDAIKISSPYAGAGFISAAHYREFVLPFERQIADAIRSQGVHAYTHTCGAISDRLELMVRTGVSGVECLDPPPLGNVSLKEAKTRLRGKAFIKGNIDPVNTLLLGTREGVERDVDFRLGVGMPGGGYILSTACSIAPHTKKEHVQLLAERAERSGYY